MGLFVAFEGIEGSGKSTQSKLLKRRLAGAGYSVTLAHEPGGTPSGERIRRLLKRGPDIPPITELLLFSASRAALVESVIRPALRRGEVVICDRYIYSTLAYQGYGRGLPLDTVRRLNEIATGGLLPQLVVLLDLPPEVGLARKPRGPADRFEQEHQEFHERVRQGYLKLAMEEPACWLVLDASASRASLAKAVWKRVSGLLRKDPL